MNREEIIEELHHMAGTPMPEPDKGEKQLVKCRICYTKYWRMGNDRCPKCGGLPGDTTGYVTERLRGEVMHQPEE